MRAILSFIGAAMRSLPALSACVFLFAASAASADSRVFIIANQADCGHVRCREYVAITCQR